MAENKPWIKSERKMKAVHHAEYMNDVYSNEIKDSVERSNVYGGTLTMKLNKGCQKPNIEVVDDTTDGAIYKRGDGWCALNFASYKFPGGGYIIGAWAQEEALCHVSNLYNVLSDDKFAHYYENHRNNLNRGMYTDFAIYSPDIVFEDFNQKVYKANVITCAAPNMSRMENSDEKELFENAMVSRIHHILDVAEVEGQKKLILGAFGCGVFKNDPYHVARTFKKFIDSGEYSFTDIVFAIPSGVNLEAFKTVFNG